MPLIYSKELEELAFGRNPEGLARVANRSWYRDHINELGEAFKLGAEFSGYTVFWFRQSNGGAYFFAVAPRHFDHPKDIFFAIEQVPHL